MQPLNLPYHSIAGYHLVRQIGSGGMGDVFKAWHEELQRTAAVKILHQPDMADRFKNEAYIQSGVHHPNIARLYEYTTAGNKPCIIMEYVDGESLDQYLHRKGKLNNDEGVKILLQIVSALQYLHEKQIHHRDLKPQNFRIQTDGTVKMLDFGIAKHKYSPKFTREGFIVGTTEYMAPEQFAQKAGIRSDIWSLGVMAYELVTGFMPFETGDLATQRNNILRGAYTAPLVLVPSLSPILASLIERCLRVNPQSRATAAELKILLAGEREISLYEKLTTKIPASKNIYVVAAVSFVCLLFFTFLLNRESSISDQSSTDPNTKLPFTTEPSQKKPVQVSNPQTPAKPELQGAGIPAERRLRISVPGIDGASLLFKDGQRFPAPYEIKGRDGQQIGFTIQANGYRDKNVEIELRMGPQTYEFILEKINY